jgi:hypothetical protein
MRKLAITLLAGGGALFVGSANASDIYTGSEYTNSDLLQPVRMVCDEDGVCYRSRGGRRVISKIPTIMRRASDTSSAIAIAIGTMVRGPASASERLA